MTKKRRTGLAIGAAAAYIDISHVLETDAKDTFEKIEELYNFDLDSNAK